MLHNDVRPTYRAFGLGEHFVFAAVNYPPISLFLTDRGLILEGIFFKHLSQFILSSALSDADPTKLIKSIDEVWQIVCGTADQGQAKGEIFSLLVCSLVVHRRFKDKGMGGHGVLSHHLRVVRNGSLKDIGINTLVSQETIRAFLAFKGADYASKGVAKTTAESRAKVRWQQDRGFTSDRKNKSGKVEFFQTAAPTHPQVYEYL